MPFSLSFAERHRYSLSESGITIPVALSSASKRIQLLAKVDTGAAYCVFQREYAEALRIDIESGELADFSTVAGKFQAYRHEVTLEVLGVRFDAFAYFYADPAVGRNVLGRSGWLNRVRLGLIDHDGEIYLSPYDEP